MSDIIYSTTGNHCIADFYDIESVEYLTNINKLVKLAKSAISISGAELIKLDYHLFKPQGITLLAILAESSLAIHVYPESRYMSVDIYTCGEKAKPHLGITYIKDILKPGNFSFRELKRGDQETRTIEDILYIDIDLTKIGVN